MAPSYHTHAPWRKAVLIPFWTIQLGLELVYIALLAFAASLIARWRNFDEENETYFDYNEVENRAYIVVPIWMVCVVFLLLLTILEIVQFARHKLTPRNFVIYNTIKATLFTIQFIIDIISSVDNFTSYTSTILNLVIEAALWLCFIIPLIYGSIIYHRSRTESRYAPVQDPLHERLNPDALPPTPDHTYTGYSANTHSTPLDIQAQPEADGYVHQRDKRFEEYRRTSYGESWKQKYGELNAEEYRGAEGVPQVYVQNHDGEAFEMESSRRSLV